ncbi:MAG TPA: preprotein translocase subunit SecA [Blastocatellia bacterium]|nr:preprotein translocase subunit SecA [Blastocatellia bacterium]HMX28905.1 preprotein translocase subunit SecA [Blastocatellia bacterium]HMZ22727.1 preprotein translocase subunit SecA [Blastocatellia bacterium]HNG34050.1 preprotein translocase subunit SecA [Blastocatellia bacterium]
MNAFEKALTKIFGSANERLLKKLFPVVVQINQLEPEIKRLSDEQLRAKTEEFRARLVKRLDGVDELPPAERKQIEQAALDELLPEAFACVREASMRSTGMRHFDVQLIGGMILHSGRIAEMRTGEGKTLVATLPVYLNALLGKGVHVVTVNDYLARRDSEWMGRIYKFLGMTVGVIQNDLDDFERQEAYKCDITYGTNNEFGFDYLRDNMKFELSTCVQRGHYYAIVDEVDSILIDEARTPLIISGASDDSTSKYYEANEVIPKLARDVDYQVDEKQHRATLTESGIEKSERMLGYGNLFDPSNMEMLHCLNQALVAHTLYQLDKQYIVRDGEVVIVDEFTGRIMTGRRWSDGLHQAVEAKEGVKIERETQTLATVTLQNYFRMYQKLGGMTGTAETEAAEFAKIYDLEVASVPTHRPMVRTDNPDMIYRTLEEKWEAVVEEIKELHEKGQPVLVGTVSVETSELISHQLKRMGIRHNVLNAKPENAGREAEIVAQAGRKGAVTIATNMAGRGTDILLGGNTEFLAKELLKKQEINPDEATPEQLEEAARKVKPAIEAEHQEVVGLGGLHILGTERHESRRIDNQLRGRAGRQGDPGSSRFFLSLEDDLMRIFAGDRVKAIMQRLGMERGVAIESKMVSKRIEAAQKNVEDHNFTIRKHLLEYDDVMNKQRTTIYTLRRQLLEQADQREEIQNTAGAILDMLMDDYLSLEEMPDQWDFDAFRVQIEFQFGLNVKEAGLDLENLERDDVRKAVWDKLQQMYSEKETLVGAEAMRYYERIIRLNIVDGQWKDHLLAIDHLKEWINQVGYAQKDPLVEYKKQSFDLFEAMLDRIDMDTVRALYHLQVTVEQPPEERIQRRPRRGHVTFTKANASAAMAGEDEGKPRTVVNTMPKIGRNDPCYCGSGKKYKKCHGSEA